MPTTEGPELMNVEDLQRENLQKVAAAPPRRQKGRGWVWLLVLALLGGGGYELHRRYPDFGVSLFKPKPAQMRQGARTIPVVVATARRGDLPIYLDGLGTVTALNTVTVRSRVEGEITKIGFVEGQNVQAGDLLFQIDTRPYEVQLAQAEGQLAKDQASLNFAKLDLARYEAAPKTIVTQQQRDTAIAQVGQNEGLVRSDQAQIDSIKLQLNYCRIVAPLSGRIGLRLVDQGNLVHANDPNGLAVITQLEPISVVFSLSEDVLPQVLKARATGQTLTVEARNRDRTQLLATGTLLALDNQVDPANLMVKLKAAFENKQHTLYPNQAVNVRLLVNTRKDAVLIPTSAVQYNPQSATYAYVATIGPPSAESADPARHSDGAGRKSQVSEKSPARSPDKSSAGSDRKSDAGPEGSVVMRVIGVGPSEGDLVVVEKGINAGEMVVTDGVDKLQPGSRVVIQTSRHSTSHASVTESQAESAPERRSR